MSEPFTITVTGWELTLLVFGFYLAGAYTILTLCRHSRPKK